MPMKPQPKLSMDSLPQKSLVQPIVQTKTKLFDSTPEHDADVHSDDDDVVLVNHTDYIKFNNILWKQVSLQPIYDLLITRKTLILILTMAKNKHPQ